MNYDPKKSILIKQEISNPIKLVGAKHKAFLITQDKGYELQKVCYSNSILAYTETANAFSQIQDYYIAREVKINGRKLDTLFKKQRNIVTREEINDENHKTKFIDFDDVQMNYGYGNEQLQDIKSKFMLIHVDGQIFIRHSFELLRKMSVMYRSTLSMNMDTEYLKKTYPEYIVEFIVQNLHGSSVEISCFLMLELCESKTYTKSEFLAQAHDIVIDDLSPEDMKTYFESIFVSQEYDVYKKIQDLSD